MDSDEQYTPQYLAADRSQRLLVVAVLFAVLEVIFLVLHFTTRYTKNAARGAETYLLVPAFFFCFANSIIAFCKFLNLPKKLSLSRNKVLIWTQMESKTAAWADIPSPSLRTNWSTF